MMQLCISFNFPHLECVDIVLTIDDFELLFYSKLESQGLETSFPRLSLSMM